MQTAECTLHGPDANNLRRARSAALARASTGVYTITGGRRVHTRSSEGIGRSLVCPQCTERLQGAEQAAFGVSVAMADMFNNVVVAAVGFFVAMICFGAWKDASFLARFLGEWGTTLKLLATLTTLWSIRQQRGYTSLWSKDKLTKTE